MRDLYGGSSTICADGAVGDTGPQGPTGPTGATGDTGPQGTIPVSVKTKFPSVPLTEGSRVKSSPTIAGDGYFPFRAFDNIYGENAISVYSNPHAGGWLSNHNDTTSSLIVNGVNTIGRFIYLDIKPDSTMAIITSFQIYGMLERFPIEYHVIGSNDMTSWSSLYHTTSVETDGSLPHGQYNMGYTSEIKLTSNYQYYRYVGLLVISQSFFNGAAHTAIQELLLYSIR
jgi:hypothetical protein